MKTSIEIPDARFRRAKSRAAERGQALEDLVPEALHEKLAEQAAAVSAAPPWMAGFGRLRRLRGETARIRVRIEEEFERIEPEDAA